MRADQGGPPQQIYLEAQTNYRPRSKKQPAAPSDGCIILCRGCVGGERRGGGLGAKPRQRSDFFELFKAGGQASFWGPKLQVSKKKAYRLQNSARRRTNYTRHIVTHSCHATRCKFLAKRSKNLNCKFRAGSRHASVDTHLPNSRWAPFFFGRQDQLSFRTVSACF